MRPNALPRLSHAHLYGSVERACNKRIPEPVWVSPEGCRESLQTGSTGRGVKGSGLHCRDYSAPLFHRFFLLRSAPAARDLAAARAYGSSILDRLWLDNKNQIEASGWQPDQSRPRWSCSMGENQSGDLNQWR